MGGRGFSHIYIFNVSWGSNLKSLIYKSKSFSGVGLNNFNYKLRLKLKKNWSTQVKHMPHQGPPIRNRPIGIPSHAPLSI